MSCDGNIVEECAPNNGQITMDTSAFQTRNPSDQIKKSPQGLNWIKQTVWGLDESLMAIMRESRQKPGQTIRLTIRCDGIYCIGSYQDDSINTIRLEKMVNILRMTFSGFPHFGQDEIPYLFQTISWPQDQFSLPICRIQVGNIGDYMRQNMAY